VRARGEVVCHVLREQTEGVKLLSLPKLKIGEETVLPRELAMESDTKIS
jgi:hypothetical protein